MSEHEILTWIHNTPLGVATRDIIWLFPTFETLHFIGLCILLGAMLIVDLRLLGRFRSIPPAKVLVFSHVAAIGLAINVVSGVGFFAADPFNYWSNPAFQIKALLLVFAFANIAWFELGARKRILALPAGQDTDVVTKVTGAISLTLWFTILIIGRLLPNWEGAGGFF
ncbi:MAG: hypothetical protein JWP92_2119 [Caulobacter sp.]|nr:hypothetical protein [Caulobacter sp.]